MIGATGGTGASITEELVRRGIHAIAFGRSRQKLEQFAVRLGNPAHLTLAVGDAMKPADIASQAGDADVWFHCANVPYHEMSNQVDSARRVGDGGGFAYDQNWNVQVPRDKNIFLLKSLF